LSGIDRIPKKACKFCKQLDPKHYPFQCQSNPKVALQVRQGLKRTPIKKIGKTTKQGLVTRATWIRRNPPDKDGYWYCYLRIHPRCTPKLTIDANKIGYGVGLLTIDHVVARSKDPSKRFDQDNLRPSCSYCNHHKASKSLDQVKAVYIE